MKKLRLLGFLMVGALLFNSCEITEPCEEDNFGSVTVNNNMTTEYQFDVTFEKNSDDKWVTNENIDIIAGSSATWDNVGSGTVAVWVNTTNEGWIIAKTIELANCEDLEVSFNSQCELENSGEAIVVNNTGFTIVVDVKNGSSGFLGERTLYDEETTSYTADANKTIAYWAQPVGGDWIHGDDYNVDICGTFTFTWTSSKLASLKSAVKPAGSITEVIDTPKKVDAPEGLNLKPQKVQR